MTLTATNFLKKWCVLSVVTGILVNSGLIPSNRVQSPFIEVHERTRVSKKSIFEKLLAGCGSRLMFSACKFRFVFWLRSSLLGFRIKAKTRRKRRRKPVEVQEEERIGQLSGHLSFQSLSWIRSVVDGSIATGSNQWGGRDERKAVLQAEMDRMTKLPANSSYATHRMRVLNKILLLLSIQRTTSQTEELELLFAGLSI
ncbi:hypothetical protein ACLOJK_031677 [Asimina triloba]